MGILQNFDVIVVGIAIAAIGLLGFIVYFNDKKSFTNKTFFIFSLVAVAWNGVNYLAYQFSSPVAVLWLLRLVLFFAVWYSFNLFQLFYVFPLQKVVFPKWYTKVLIPIVAVVSAITLSPLAIIQINQLANGASSGHDELGIGMAFFGFTVVSLIIGGVTIFIRKTRRTDTMARPPYRLILTGTSITFSLYLIFNFILPTVFNNIRFIPLGAIFTFPLIAFTSYAIIKHRLFNVKVISTEILVFVLSIVTLFEVISSGSIIVLILRLSEFALVLGFGIMLIQSVVREVKQREQLEILTKRLEVANEQLKVLDQARAEFISIASHQLRTPPATVKWYLSAIINGDYGQVDPSVKEMLVKTERTNNLLISLIEDILNVSRIERGKMEFLFAQTDVLDLAKITYEQLQPLASEKKQKLAFVAPKTKIPSIMADKEKLRQVMNNMIDNAIKYTPAGGTITVSLTKTKDDLVFQVQDTGKGISKEDASNIFQKFSRGKESIKQSAGLGLGLYVAKVIVEQHKGRLWAESDGVGKGSRFIFSLPIKNGLKETTLFDLTKAQPTELIKNSQTA